MRYRVLGTREVTVREGGIERRVMGGRTLGYIGTYDGLLSNLFVAEVIAEERWPGWQLTLRPISPTLVPESVA